MIEEQIYLFCAYFTFSNFFLFIGMFISLIASVFLLLMIIERVNGGCKSSEFFPCACCDPISHYCVHKSASILGQISKCPIFKIYNPSCKLDTSMYCCVPKPLAGNDVNNDNITLFSKYCKKHPNLIGSLNPLVNTIIPSCDPISKRCYNARNSVDTAILPGPMVVASSTDKQETEDVTMPIVIPEKIIHKNEEEVDDNKKSLNIIEQDDSNIQPNENQQDTNEDEEEKNEEINTDESTNRAVIKYQPIGSLVLIITTIALVTIN